MRPSQSIYSNSLLEFEVRRRHFFKDRVYNLFLLPDKLLMAEPTQLKQPKYVFKLDLSLTLIWVYNKTGCIEGFDFPYQGKRKIVYGQIDGMTKLKTLMKGRIFFAGDNFNLSYKFVCEISKGQFGRVKEMYHQQVGKYTCGNKPFAVKVIDKKTTLKQKNGVDTLINEIMILSRMDNPNVIKLHEVYQDDINFYLVMDFVDGLTLRQEIQNYKYDWVSSERALRLLKQLAMGVAYLHSHGIIHRDIKPSNLMVQHDRLIIIDLGLSCFNGEQLRILPDCGTVGYMAPELFKPQKDYDCKVDMFSVGCVFYRLVSGRQAFNGRNEEELFKLNRTGAVDIQCLKASPLVTDLLMLLLDTNPDTRVSAEETVTILENQGISVRETLAKHRRKRSISKERQFSNEKTPAIKRSSLKKSPLVLEHHLIDSPRLIQSQDCQSRKMPRRQQTNQQQDSPLREVMKEDIQHSSSQAGKTYTSIKETEPKAKRPLSQFNRPPVQKKQPS